MAKIVRKLGDDISTDIIYPGRFMATVLPTETPQFAFADDADLNGRLKKKEIAPGSVLLGGKNFGCGSSREQAASCLVGHGLIIVARDFARIFLQNGINLGLQTVICPDIDANEGDELEITETAVTNTATGKTYARLPLPKARQAIVDAGGLIPYARKKLLEEKGKK
ncbi:MAG TPA: 3-isopropylmalate dehydratase [Acidobacteriota bacterium]|jgi:3-isopropylmalate/(R)-2-methylmalate dehydratase small subunit|nr:3-isopropylmalate dehydratase [Acidobacteriota bacterium]HQO27376.1 3-isopropylmalate dehydratase [Acidobacteriota bacterium]